MGIGQLGFRSFVEQLDKNGELTKIKREVSIEYEMAGVIEAIGEKPVFFEKIKESRIPVVGGLLSSKDLIARGLAVKKEELLQKLSTAIENPVPPQIVNSREGQENDRQ